METEAVEVAVPCEVDEVETAAETAAQAAIKRTSRSDSDDETAKPPDDAAKRVRLSSD